MSTTLIRSFTGLRTARLHLERQVEDRVDTKAATWAEAQKWLDEVDAQLKELEPQVRALPEAAYLFGKRNVRSAGRTRVRPPQSLEKSNTTPKEGTSMARQSKAAKLEETLIALRKAEKSAGTTKWALEGAGAAKNPPTPERKKALQEKLAKEQALVASLRATRDELKPKAAA